VPRRILSAWGERKFPDPLTNTFYNVICEFEFDNGSFCIPFSFGKFYFVNNSSGSSKLRIGIAPGFVPTGLRPELVEFSWKCSAYASPEGFLDSGQLYARSQRQGRLLDLSTTFGSIFAQPPSAYGLHSYLTVQYFHARRHMPADVVIADKVRVRLSPDLRS